MVESPSFPQIRFRVVHPGAARYMSPRQWHSVLPSGALSSSALVEDLEPVLQQSGYFGRNYILLAGDDFRLAHFPRVERSIREKQLLPQRLVSLEEFAVSEKVAALIEHGNHLVIIIDQEPSAAAIDRMIATRPHLDQLTYVVMGRKDWRFKDAYRSLPHFVRARLCVDFPVSLHHFDPYYSPAELKPILDELKEASGFAAPVSFSPHYGLRRELLRANIIAVSGPSEASSFSPEISIVVTDPETVNRLAAEGGFQELAPKIEFVVSRVIGQENTPIHPVAAPVSHVWLHLEESARGCPEIGAHLRNWGARFGRGKFLLFADGESAQSTFGALKRLLSGLETEAEVLKSGQALVLSGNRFREAGGFDPLYFRFGLGEAELLHRYLGGMSLTGQDSALAESLRNKIGNSYRALGASLFFHQYFDEAFFRYFSPSASEVEVTEQENNSRLRSQVRYRLEQSRDAYLGIYKASPRVALDGHIQILLKPYHWVKPYAWLLKMPVYPLIVQPYHRLKLHAWLLKMPVYPLIVKPYHRLKPHAWLLKMPVYPLVVRPFHWIKRHVWLLKVPVVQPFHFLRQYAWRFFRENIWKIKHVYYFAKVGCLRVIGQLWRVKQLYYFFFRMLFPIRKIYYFAEYQFEKRILGLYGRQHVWVKK